MHTQAMREEARRLGYMDNSMFRMPAGQAQAQASGWCPQFPTNGGHPGQSG